ncbi:RDD family protein [Sporosarcina sp. FSL K6-3457]|uniref:RDD family protein n=1 Tax=Sporosarcina sp. FSL K6-3457 TaxID=2978204 RepID=UPI004046A58F
MDKFLPNYFRYAVIITIIFFIISILYFGILTSTKMQGMVGKLLLGIKVVGQDGNRISFGRAVGRHFATMISSFMYVGYILAVFNEKKQTLHDYMANTFVVKR